MFTIVVPRGCVIGVAIRHWLMFLKKSSLNNVKLIKKISIEQWPKNHCNPNAALIGKDILTHVGRGISTQEQTFLCNKGSGIHYTCSACTTIILHLVACRVTTIPIMMLVSRVHLFFYLICINLVTFATKGTVFYFLILSTIYLDRKFRTVTNPQFKTLQGKISMQREIFSNASCETYLDTTFPLN